MQKLIKQIAEHCKWEIGMADLEGRNTQEAKWRSHVAERILQMIKMDSMDSRYYIIKYYFKDDSDPINTNEALVCVGTDIDESRDDDIFFYYEHMDHLVDAWLCGDRTLEDFVVVDYWSADEEKEAFNG